MGDFLYLLIVNGRWLFKYSVSHSFQNMQCTGQSVGVFKLFEVRHRATLRVVFFFKETGKFYERSKVFIDVVSQAPLRLMFEYFCLP